MRKTISRLTIVLSLLLVIGAFVPTVLSAAPGDLFVQVDDTIVDRCSILRVTPTGVISEWVTSAAILAATGEAGCDFSDTGMAITRDGTLYFNDDTSDDILMVSPAGVVTVFVTEATLDAAATGDTADIDNGMALGSDGNLYAADENGDVVLKITVPGGVVTIEVTKAQITGATGESSADLEGFGWQPVHHRRYK